MLNIQFNNNAPLKIIAGPCQIESYDHAMKMAEIIADICHEVGIRWVYKSSFDKANRSSIDSLRGVGIEQGLKILKKIALRLTNEDNILSIRASIDSNGKRASSGFSKCKKI